MLETSAILDILNKKYEITAVSYDFYKLYKKDTKIIYTKKKSEIEFIADYISYNYQNVEKPLIIKATEELLDLLDCCPTWNAQGIYTYLSDIGNYQTNANLLNNLLNFLFSNQRTIPFRNIIKKLLSRKEIYSDRVVDQQMATLKETAIQLVIGRSAYDKLPVTNTLITILFNFSLRTSETNNYIPLILTESEGNQLREIDTLGVIYSDLLELAVLYHIQLPDDSEAMIELKKYVTNLQNISVSSDTKLFAKSLEKMKIAINKKSIFDDKALPLSANTSLSENFNNLCFDYLIYIKDKLSINEIESMMRDINFGISGSILSLLNSVYNHTYDYTKPYSRFISEINEACKIYFNNNYANPKIASALIKISQAIYENPLPLERTRELLLQYIAPGLGGHYDNIDTNFFYSQLIKSDSKQELFRDPRTATSSLMRSKSSFGDDFDAMSYTNLPSILSLESFLRMGVQAYTSNGNVYAYPLFLQYIKTIKNKMNTLLLNSEKRSFTADIDTSFLYICNLRTAGYTTEVEANAESIKVKALIDASENNTDLGFELVVMPANRGYLNPNQRKKNGCLDRCLHLNKIISELKQIVYSNGQDFYLSQRVRNKLFSSNTEEDILKEIHSWIQEAVEELGFNVDDNDSNECKISMSERQQLAIHFFKYTLTKKLIDNLKPYRITMPCKDFIDRGMVHFIYFKIINLITTLHNKIINNEIPSENILKEKSSLDNQINNILHLELHSASLLVKARRVNDDNLGLLVHTLDGFTKGKIFDSFSDVDFKLLHRWLNKNRHRVSAHKLSIEEKSSFITVDQKESEDRLSLLLPPSTELSKITRYIPDAVKAGEKVFLILDGLVSYVRSGISLTFLYSNSNNNSENNSEMNNSKTAKDKGTRSAIARS